MRAAAANEAATAVAAALATERNAPEAAAAAAGVVHDVAVWTASARPALVRLLPAAHAAHLSPEVSAAA